MQDGNRFAALQEGNRGTQYSVLIKQLELLGAKVKIARGYANWRVYVRKSTLFGCILTLKNKSVPFFKLTGILSPDFIPKGAQHSE